MKLLSQTARCCSRMSPSVAAHSHPCFMQNSIKVAFRRRFFGKRLQMPLWFRFGIFGSFQEAGMANKLFRQQRAMLPCAFSRNRIASRKTTSQGKTCMGQKITIFRYSMAKSVFIFKSSMICRPIFSATGGGKALPIMRQAAVFLFPKLHVSGKPCIRASILGVRRGIP